MSGNGILLLVYHNPQLVTLKNCIGIMGTFFLILFAGFLVNDRCLFSEVAKRGNSLRYLAEVFGLSVVVVAAQLIVNRIVQIVLDIPFRPTDLSSPWFYVYAFCGVLTMMFYFSGFAVYEIYSQWKRNVSETKMKEKALSEKVRRLKENLNPGFISDSFKGILSVVSLSADEARERIVALTDYLRGQLYDLDFTFESEHEISREAARLTPLQRFLCERRFRAARTAILLFLLFLLSFQILFTYPDAISFEPKYLVMSVVQFCIYGVIIGVSSLVLYPVFLKKGKEIQYLKGIAWLFAIFAAYIVGYLVWGLFTVEKLQAIPLVVSSLISLGSLLTPFLILMGVNSFLYVQNQIECHRRQTELEIEQARCELSYLRKQINPHFLFNMLNNAGELIYENPEKGREILESLQRLLDYQLGDTERSHAPLSEEVAFLRSYLKLEKERRESLDYKVDVEGDSDNVLMPTLLCIPFVENAVKYATRVQGAEPYVRVSFRRDRDRLVFHSVNNYDPAHKPERGASGGLGIDNTRHRLRLMYSRRARLDITKRENEFDVTLSIPMSR